LFIVLTRRDLLRTEHSVGPQTVRHLATQANQSRRDYLAAATEPTRDRVLHLLADPTGTVHLPDGQSGLATGLGLTRLTINRTLQHLSKQGHLTTIRHTIHLTPTAD
jgi:DNA-binding MarR family transcriptional regulator